MDGDVKDDQAADVIDALGVIAGLRVRRAVARGYLGFASGLGHQRLGWVSLRLSDGSKATKGALCKGRPSGNAILARLLTATSTARPLLA